jgi:hypothetical protein
MKLKLFSNTLISFPINQYPLNFQCLGEVGVPPPLGKEGELVEKLSKQISSLFKGRIKEGF